MSLMDGKITMFDQGVKIANVIWRISILFLHAKSKIKVMKKYEPI